MQTVAKRVKDQIQLALLKAYEETFPHELSLLEAEVTQATQLRFGHYQCNNPLKLAKLLKVAPTQVAQEIISHLPLGPTSFIHKVEIAPAGFINITLSKEFLAKEIQFLLNDPQLGVAKVKEPTRVVVEFSSPNIAKELHVGHLRSTIIGDALARLFEFLGYDVLRLNHVGDWGTQFGMLIAYLKKFHPDFFQKNATYDLAQLMQWYREAKVLFDADLEFKKQAQLEVILLQGGEETSLEAWEMICDVSRQAFQEIYQILDVKIQERGESFYNPYLKEVVEDLEQKELVTVSDGAKCIFMDGFFSKEGTPLPMIIQKSDGGYNYDTTDVAAMRHRIEKEHATRIIVVTDAGQSLHFQMLRKVCEKAGYLVSHTTQFDHVPFGVVLGPDGKKFKTRSGTTEKLIDLITEAIRRAKNIFKERLQDATASEVDTLGTILGVDAIKYADLSSHRLKDYAFSYERMLKFEGNTAAFLLYAYVRIQGIKRKIGKEVNKAERIVLEEPSEDILALHLCQFSETLEAMAKDLLPNRLCEYLYELAEKFNAFFRDCRVEGSELQKSRLALCEVTSLILAKGLDILGLKTLAKM